MANWNGLQLTNKGIALQAKVQAGTTLSITKLKLGSGVVPSGTDIKTLTDLIAPEQNLGIGAKEAVGDYCKISSTISNTGLAAGYYVRELGVFAQDPDDGEVLYAYTTDGAPDYLPAGGGSTVISQEFSVMIAVDDVDNIEVDIDPAALATMGYVQLQIGEHDESEDAHEPAFEAHNADENAHLNMVGASSSAAGKRGMVPAPAACDQDKFLRGDGSWADAKMTTKDLVDILYPVGSIYMSTNAANPGTLWPGTTWEAYAQGRVLIGAGTGTDSRSEQKTFAAGSTGGEYNHQLTVGELASHNHSGSVTSASLSGQARIAFKNGGMNLETCDASGIISSYSTGTVEGYGSGSQSGRPIGIKISASHTHSLTINNNGSGVAHNNLQPYLSVYMWRRTV